MLEQYERYAHIYHDTLVELGGRPTRTVLEKPAWKANYEKDQIRIVNNDGELECTLGPDMDITYYHWDKESTLFLEELDQWEEFRDWQRRIEHQPLLNIPFDPENMDQRLVKILVSLNDWREFQHYQQVKVGRAAMRTWSINQKIRNNLRIEATSEKADLPKVQRHISACIHELYSRQQDLEDSEKQLTWIELQVPDILSEACASLDDASPLQRELEMLLKQQANAFYQDMKGLEARPHHSMQTPHQSAGFAEIVCHWGSEISRLMQERWEWKIFLKWRRNQPSTSKVANSGQQEPSGRSFDLQLWVDHVAYRKFQLERTQDWVVGWQRLLKEDEDRMKTPLQGAALSILQDTIEMVRAYVERFKEDVHTAESQLGLAEQQLAELSSQQPSSAAVQITQQSTGHPQLPPSPAKSDSTESIPGNSQLPNSSSFPTKVNRPRGSSESPLSDTLESFQQSNAPDQNRGTQAKNSIVGKKQSSTVADDFVSDQVIVDEDIQMTDAPGDLYPHETVKDDKVLEFKDTLLTAVKDFSSPPAPAVNLKVRSTEATRKWPLPIDQVPTSRKTRSVTKPNSHKILKNKGKKHAKKLVPFTKHQSTALLGSTSTNYPTRPITLRRSERLKKRVPASAFTSLP